VQQLPDPGKYFCESFGELMKYRVTFMERTGVTGEPSERPQDYVAI